VHHEERRFDPRPRGDSENCAIAIAISRGQRSEQVDIGASLVRRRLAGSKVRFIARRAGIVGGQKTRRTVAVMELAQIRGVVLNPPIGFAPRS
jgi:hypothetical protein